MADDNIIPFPAEPRKARAQALNEAAARLLPDEYRMEWARQARIETATGESAADLLRRRYQEHLDASKRQRPVCPLWRGNRPDDDGPEAA